MARDLAHRAQQSVDRQQSGGWFLLPYRLAGG